MSAASRRKGVAGEREVARVFEGAGWTVRGLEGSGDWLAFLRGHSAAGSRPVDIPDRTVHAECKRYGTRARFPEWFEQARTEAPPGVPPVLCTRADHGEWLVTLRLADLLELVG